MSEPVQYGWVIPARLASETPLGAPIWDELGLNPVLDVAKWCYSVRDAGAMLAPDGAPWLEHDRWLRAAFGLAGSVAESLVVCAGCEVEIAVHVRDGDPKTEIASRFFSIASSQELVGVGHRLLNLAQRAICARTDYREALRTSQNKALSQCAEIGDPRSSDRKAWLSLNISSANALRRALRLSSHPSICGMLGELRMLAASEEWRRLDETRGEVFHRSRPESSVSAGLDSGSGFTTLISDPDGHPIGYSVGTRNRYISGDGRMSHEATVARDGLHRIALSAKKITESLVLAVEPLTEGHRSYAGENGLRQHIGRSWDDSRCECCSGDATEAT